MTQQTTLENIEYLGKKVRIYITDSILYPESNKNLPYPIRKIGILLEMNDSVIRIKNSAGHCEFIPIYKILRMVLTGGHNGQTD